MMTKTWVNCAFILLVVVLIGFEPGVPGVCCAWDCHGLIRNGYCYFEIMDEMTQSEAESACQDYAGHLVSIHSQEEQDFIAIQVRSIAQKYHIGLIKSSCVVSDCCGYPVTKAWIDETAFDFEDSCKHVYSSGYAPSCSSSFYSKHGFMREDGSWGWKVCGSDPWILPAICKVSYAFSDLPDCSAPQQQLNATTLGITDRVSVAVSNISSSADSFIVNTGVRVMRKSGVVNIITFENIDHSTWEPCDIPSSASGWVKTTFSCYDEYWTDLDFFDILEVTISSTGTQVVAGRSFWIHSIDTSGSCSIVSYPENVQIKFNVVVSSVGRMEKFEGESEDLFPITGIRFHSLGSVGHSDWRMVMVAQVMIIDSVEITAASEVSGSIEYEISFDGVKKQYTNGDYYYNLGITTSRCPRGICDSSYVIKFDIKDALENIVAYQYAFDVKYTIPRKDGYDVTQEVITVSEVYSKNSFSDEDITETFEVTKPIFVHSQSVDHSSILDLEFKVKESFMGCSSHEEFVCPGYDAAGSSSFTIFKSLISGYNVVVDSTSNVALIDVGSLISGFMARFSFFPNFVEESSVCCLYVQNGYRAGRRRVEGKEIVGKSMKQMKVVVPPDYPEEENMDRDDTQRSFGGILFLFFFFQVVFLY